MKINPRQPASPGPSPVDSTLGAPPASGPAGSARSDPPAGVTPAGGPAVDPLRERLTHAIAGKDLSDPAQRLEAELLVMRETLLSVFGQGLFQNAEMEEMLSTFQGYVQNDPGLREMFQSLLNQMTAPPR